MKKIIALFFILVGLLPVYGQQNEFIYDFDTLEVYENKTLVIIKEYENGKLIEESTTFLFPVTRSIPKFRLTGNLIKTKVYMDSIVRHGPSTKFYSDNRKKVIEYENGTQIRFRYFDSNGQDVTREEFGEEPGKIGPCGKVKGEYFFHGRKKEKIKKND